MKKIIFALLLPFMLHAQSAFKNETVSTYPTLLDLTYDDAIPDRIYARSSNNHIVYSNDNGQTWDVLYSHIQYINSLQLMPGEHTLTFSTQEQLFLYNTQTNTVSAEIPVPPHDFDESGQRARILSSYSFYNASGAVILVNYFYKVNGEQRYQKTYYTENSGNTWTMVYDSTAHDNVYSFNEAIAPNNPQKIFIARGLGNGDVNGGLWVSENAGQTWDTYLDGQPLFDIAFNPQNSDEMLVGSGVTGENFPQAVFKSTDAGSTWVNLDIQWSDYTSNNSITDIVYHPANPNAIAILEANELVTTIDGGATWHIQSYASTATDYSLPITGTYNPTSNQLLISTGFYPQSTVDAGVTFTPIHAPYCLTSGISLNHGVSPKVYYEFLHGYAVKDLEQQTTATYDISPFTFYYS